MKKNLFYAAFALAMMASCTNEDNLVVDPVNPTPDAEDKVAITLGIDAPSVNATLGGRSTGSVGDVADPQGTAAENKKNKWNGQQLYIAMFEKGTTNIAEVDGTEVLTFDNHQYYAPRGTENTESGDIRIYNSPLTNNNDEGVLQYEYYPVSGQYDFYGYHVDDAGGTTSTEAPLKVTGIQIKGWQDIMGARTKEFTEANYKPADFTGNWADMTGWDFSARTARNKIKPILKFEHQLARLKFFVRAGSDQTALMEKNAQDAWVEKENVTGQQVTNAMYIKSLTVNDLIQNLTMDLDATVDGKKCIETTPADETLKDFVLGEYDATTNSIVELKPVAPIWPISQKNEDTYKETPVGESIMFFPYGDSKTQLTLDLELTQWVIDTEDETKADGATDKYTWTQKTQPATVIVKAENVKLDGVAQTAFEAGKSYNVYITVYGFERIEVTAELTPWTLGGDVDVDIENDAVNNGAGTGTQTPTTYDITFNVTDGNNAIANPVITVSSPTEATVSGTTITVPAGTQSITYSVTAQGYDPITDATATVDATTNNTVNVTMSAQAPTTEKVTVTINATPADATVTINGQTVSTLEVEKGTDVTWSVAKEGYTTQEGTYSAIAEDKTETITLVGEERTVTFTVSGYKAETTPTITVGEQEITGTTTTAKVGDVISWKVTGTKEDDSAAEKTGTFTVVADINNNTITVNLAE